MKKLLITLMLACIALWATDADAVGQPSLHKGYIPPVDSVLGSVVFELDVQAGTGPPATQDNQLLGVEFDGTYFYVTGGGGTYGGRPNTVWVFDTLGNAVWEIPQGGSSSWGWRDIAWDGVYTGPDRIDTLYASEEGSGVVKFGIDLTNGTLTNYGSYPGPVNPNRAMAWHADSQWFFTANWSSNCYKFSKTSSNIESVPNSYSIYGAAWDSDPTDGGWIWWYSQDDPGTGWDCQVEQFDPIAMSFTGTNFGFTSSLISTGMAGGICFYEGFRDTCDVLFALIQGTPNDVVVGCWVRSHYTGGEEQPGTGEPLAFGFAPNISNPIKAYAPITYTTTQSGRVCLKVYDGTGRYVETLVNVAQPAGAKTVNWNVKNITNGVYFLKLEAEGKTAIHKLILVQ